MKHFSSVRTIGYCTNKGAWAVLIFLATHPTAAQIIYPGGAVPEIVRRSEGFTVLCREELAGPVTSVMLEGPYNRVPLKILDQRNGRFEYDRFTHATAGLKVRVKVPPTAPEELYDLTLATAKSTAVSKRAVKVVREFRNKHTVLLISDPHITRQWSGTPEDGFGIELERFDNFVRVANLLNPDFVVVAGDLIHDYTRWNAGPDGWGGQTHDKVDQKPFVDEKWNNYYEGARGYQGLHGLRVPAFSLPGNHDHYGVPEQEHAAQWNRYCGVRIYGARYGTTRLLVRDNFLSGNAQEDDQLSVLHEFLQKSGAGSLRILAQHDNERFPVEFLNREKVQLAFAGHIHVPRVWRVEGTATEATTPGSVSKSGEKDEAMGWLRLIRVNGSAYELSPNLKYCSNSPGLPHAEQKLNLTAEYQNANDGQAVSNVATLRNGFDMDLARCRLRFVMKKGRYTVSGGTIDQAIEGDGVTVVDVDVDVARESAVHVRVFSE